MGEWGEGMSVREENERLQEKMRRNGKIIRRMERTQRKTRKRHG